MTTTTGMIEDQHLQLLRDSLRHLKAGFEHLPGWESGLDTAALAQVLNRTADRLRDNYPYFHPLYAGQMLKPPHPVAYLAYALAMSINPNNHALDGGRASSALEKEAVANIAALVDWREHLGHLTSGGTMANLEALWVAGQLNPGKAVLASSQAHYTHGRISQVLGLGFEALAADRCAHMDLEALERRLARGGVGTVVATLGTTGVGSTDPLPGILELRRRYPFRLHVDAAYGGYFILAQNLEPGTRAAYDCLHEADSIVIDPHKHGLQPYGCGCVLFRDPGVGRFYRHDSPYTYFSSSDLHLGEISLECSRAGAAATALWATQQLLPMVPGGAFARGLEAGRAAALELQRRLQGDGRFLTTLDPELDILCWGLRAPTGTGVSRRSRRQFQDAAQRNLHLALVELPAAMLEPAWDGVEFDSPTVTCLRSCLMKPEHLDWLDRIWAILDQTAG